MIRYKLTTQDMKTRKGFGNEVTWEVGKWVEAIGNNNGLCSDGYIHWYADPLLAVLLNPIHAAIKDPRLWEVETDGPELSDHGLKGGSQRLRLLREVPLPQISTEHYVRFAILAAKKVFKDKKWNVWADAWLTGKDRSANAAVNAAAAANAAVNAANAAYANAAAAAADAAAAAINAANAAYAAVNAAYANADAAAANAAINAANAAVNAANAAVNAANAAVNAANTAVNAANAAINAADAAADATYAAAYAVADATYAAADDIDLIEIAREAVHG